MKKITLLTLLIALLICSTPLKTEAEGIEKYRTYAGEVAENYGICAELIESVIYHESAWNAKATSKCGAKGLMQIRAEYNKERMERLGVTDLYDGYDNILVGVDLLAELIDDYGDVYEALVAYNNGPNSKALKNVKAGGTSEYAEKVLYYSSKLERQRGK